MQTAYTNCHVFHLDKFIPGFLDFLSEHIGLEGNGLFIWGQERYDFGLRKGYPIHWIHNKEAIPNLEHAMRKAKRVFLHGLFVPTQVELLYQEKELLKKCFWIVWGGDLYRYREPLKTPNERIYESKRRSVISRMGFISAVKGDYEIAVDAYKTTAHLISRHVYPSNFVHNDFSPAGQAKNGLLNILVGNSAEKTNRHSESFSILRKYRDHMNVVCPLTYGDRSYANCIVDLGREIFGDNFFPLLEHMPLPDYKNFLKTVHIGFFNHNRQQGMGNIANLLGMGKKVHVPRSLSHSIYLESLGLKIYDPSEFSLQVLEDDVAFRNHSIMRDTFSSGSLAKQLSELLDFDL